MQFTIFLKFLNIIKLLHWKATSHSTHKVLDDLYEEMSDKIDEFVECYLGFFPSPTAESAIDGLETPDGEEYKIFLVSSYQDMRRVAGSMAKDNTSLLSLLDDMDNIMAKSVYLLKMCGTC